MKKLQQKTSSFPINLSNLPFKSKALAPLSLSMVHITVGGPLACHPGIKRYIQALYPGQIIHWGLQPDFNIIDTYVILYLCPYGVEEHSLIKGGIQYAEQLLESQKIKFQVPVLVIFYRDIKVNFPERKLRREKFMSEMNTENLLEGMAPFYQKRITMIHEFGVYNLQDSLQQIAGRHLYFDAN